MSRTYFPEDLDQLADAITQADWLDPEANNTEDFLVADLYRFAGEDKLEDFMDQLGG